MLVLSSIMLLTAACVAPLFLTRQLYRLNRAEYAIRIVSIYAGLAAAFAFTYFSRDILWHAPAGEKSLPSVLLGMLFFLVLLWILHVYALVRWSVGRLQHLGWPKSLALLIGAPSVVLLITLPLVRELLGFQDISLARIVAPFLYLALALIAILTVYPSRRETGNS